MTDILKQLEYWRKRWLEAAKKGDSVMMGLAERWGKKLRKKVDERMKGGI